MAEKNLATMFYRRAIELGELTAVLFKPKGEQYQQMSWTDFSSLVEKLSFGLASLGIKPNSKAAIYSTTSHLWVASDFATISNGAVSVPIYPTSSLADIEYILNNSQSEVLFVQNQSLLLKVLPIRNQLPHLRTIVVHTPSKGDKPLAEVAKEHNLPQGYVMSTDEVVALGEQLKAKEPKLISTRVEATTLDDLATIIYTSGTTGTPKGVPLTHINIMGVLDDLIDILPISKDDLYLSYLPLSHVFERVCGEFYWVHSGGACAFAESIEAMAKNMAEVEPTMLLMVPRVLDRIYAKVKSGIEGASGRRRKLIDWALETGRERVRLQALGRKPNPVLSLKLAVAEKLIFAKMRERIGRRLRLVVSGGAPATPVVLEFFNAIGIQTMEGYGLTETAAPATVNRLSKIKMGTVGRALPSVQVRIAEDGEILLKGRTVFTGYYGVESSDESFEDGWFRTGDIGTLDSEGYLKITDRKKDLIVNSAGKNIAPQRIEAILKTVPLVTQAVVAGDKRKHLVALLTLDEQAAIEVAREKNWNFETFQELANSPELKKFLRKEINLRSESLAEYELVRNFSVLQQDLSVEAGELTATLKIKRNVVLAKYKPLIESLYKEEAEVGAVLSR